jgi:hypothetical protein
LKIGESAVINVQNSKKAIAKAQRNNAIGIKACQWYMVRESKN